MLLLVVYFTVLTRTISVFETYFLTNLPFGQPVLFLLPVVAHGFFFQLPTF